MNTIRIGLFEFTRRLFTGGGLSLKGVFLLPVYYFQLVAAIPFSLIQNFIFGRRIQQTEIVEDPVFIMGHYRSGTTYLQKLLGSNPGFGYLTNYDALFANTNLLLGKKMKFVFQLIINLFRIKNPFFNAFANLDDPAEEDDYLMNKASAYTGYWGFVFPKKAGQWLNDRRKLSDPHFLREWENEYLLTLKYASFKNQGRRLILKNPPSTARIDILLKLFPSAKFVYIFRNPYEVFYSTRNMWRKAILPFYSLHYVSHHQLDDIIFNHYIYLMEEYEKQKSLIPEGRLVEIRYEKLMADPYGEIKKIYNHLGLEGFEATSEKLKATIARESNYRNNCYTYSVEMIEMIKSKWGKYLIPPPLQSFSFP